jgi:hypothetical protein
MKTFLVFGLAMFAWFHVSAQVTVELSMQQQQFLPSESMPVAVKITNQSGQQIHLGAEPDWLTFNVESADGFVVIKNSEVPVLGKFDLESSQMAIKRVDLQPYFSMMKPGRYHVTATVRIPAWSLEVTSAPKHFDIVYGAPLWSQNFGVPTGTNSLPEMRKYTLEKANYLREQLRLYVQVSDPSETEVYKVSALGPLVSFSQPEAQVDRHSRLNVLWQTGAKLFDYAIVSPNGTVEEQDTYDNFYSRPRLGLNGDGEVVVVGGTRRPKPSEVPIVVAPDQMPHEFQDAPTPDSAPKKK